MTSAERLASLMPWVNGDPLSATKARRLLAAFLHEFRATGIRLSKDTGMWEVHRATPADLEATRQKVMTIFYSGFRFPETPTAKKQTQVQQNLTFLERSDVRPFVRQRTRRPSEWDDLIEDSGRGYEHIGPDDVMPPLSLPSLRFGLLGTGSKTRRQAHYEMHVNAARLRDLVPFLVLHLLTVDDIPVSQCLAPGKDDWRIPCHRLFIWTKKGRPPEVCPAGQGQKKANGRSACANRVRAQAKVIAKKVKAAEAAMEKAKREKNRHEATERKPKTRRRGRR